MTVKGSYPSTDQFYVKDSIGVPHPYCITPEHVGHAADHFSGMLNEAAIEDAEKHGAHCGVRGCQLSFAQHEQALLIACRVDIQTHQEPLREYLKSLVDEATRNGYAGFAFIRA